jgi:hypothetical protein
MYVVSSVALLPALAYAKCSIQVTRGDTLHFYLYRASKASEFKTRVQLLVTVKLDTVCYMKMRYFPKISHGFVHTN